MQWEVHEMEKKEEKKPSGSFSEVRDKRGQGRMQPMISGRKSRWRSPRHARAMQLENCIETVAYEYLRYRARRRPVFTGGYRGWHRSDDRRDYAVPTVDGTIHYLKAGKNTSKIIARAQEIQNGYAFSVCECKIYDDKETLLASATMTYYHLRKR